MTFICIIGHKTNASIMYACSESRQPKWRLETVKEIQVQQEITNRESFVCSPNLHSSRCTAWHRYARTCRHNYTVYLTLPEHPQYSIYNISRISYFRMSERSTLGHQVSLLTHPELHKYLLKSNNIICCYHSHILLWLFIKYIFRMENERICIEAPMQNRREKMGLRKCDILFCLVRTSYALKYFRLVCILLWVIYKCPKCDKSGHTSLMWKRCPQGR